MSEPRPGPERIDLLGADDPRDVVHRTVACLAQGGVVALPSETAYILAASALAPKAIERVRAIKGSNRPYAIGVRGPEEIADWIPDASDIARKLARRAWPGPVTLVVSGATNKGIASSLAPSVKGMIASESTVGLRMPAHEAIREVCELLSGPLILTDAPGRDGGRAISADDIPPGLDVDMILDEGPSLTPFRNSVIQLDGERWRVLRPGVVSERDLQRMTGTLLLFVCTGNTCRSPMAEALCRLALADRLGCAADEIEEHGWVVASAGLAASRGSRAASEALHVLESRGGSLRDHVSRQVTPSMIAAADLIIAMTRDHHDAILDEHPDAADRLRLLHPRGADIADPIGADRDTYRRTADAIDAHLKALLDEILPKYPGSPR